MTADDVVRAAAELNGVIRRTPCEPVHVLSERIGVPVLLKQENRQRTGSFKVRGAYTRISRLSEQERRRGVVAASAGNHAQGVAYAAGLVGTRARVFMPIGAALPKIDATRGYGGEVELFGNTVDEALGAARECAERTGAVLVHPFDHPDVIAGQGSTGLEILEQCPDVGTVLVALGGGGLLSGIAVAIRSLRPGVQIFGVQAEEAAAFPASLAAGRPVRLESMSTMADGIAVAGPGSLTLPIVAELVDDVLTVGEEDISRAVLLLLERAKTIAEPAGAAAVAALLDERNLDRIDLSRGPVVCVLSGGNVDPLLLQRIIRHGMTAAGRFLQLRLRLPDRPGALAALLGLLAEQGANVLEVEHVRDGSPVAVLEVEVGLRLETLGHEHSAQVLAALRERYGLVEAGALHGF